MSVTATVPPATEEHDDAPDAPEAPAARGPRVFMPLLAALMISLSLERLGALHWIAALALFGLLAMFVLGTAAAQRRRLREGAEQEQGRE